MILRITLKARIAAPVTKPARGNWLSVMIYKEKDIRGAVPYAKHARRKTVTVLVPAAVLYQANGNFIYLIRKYLILLLNECIILQSWFRFKVSFL